ncbi:uncharacterized protein LOC143247130 isoform X2 [Tachypleus tridentatus]|uniref:uncharacterized protein LOC143247130 isoform X2 n=1 Tax=Tachypleus tridentatus TaxID=6853 RepID=UPI003FD067AD
MWCEFKPESAIIQEVLALLCPVLINHAEQIKKEDTKSKELSETGQIKGPTLHVSYNLTQAASKRYMVLHPPYMPGGLYEHCHLQNELVEVFVEEILNEEEEKELKYKLESTSIVDREQPDSRRYFFQISHGFEATSQEKVALQRIVNHGRKKEREVLKAVKLKEVDKDNETLARTEKHLEVYPNDASFDLNLKSSLPSSLNYAKSDTVNQLEDVELKADILSSGLENSKNKDISHDSVMKETLCENFSESSQRAVSAENILQLDDDIKKTRNERTRKIVESKLQVGTETFMIVDDSQLGSEKPSRLNNGIDLTSKRYKENQSILVKGRSQVAWKGSQTCDWLCSKHHSSDSNKETYFEKREIQPRGKLSLKRKRDEKNAVCKSQRSGFKNEQKTVEKLNKNYKRCISNNFKCFGKNYLETNVNGTDSSSNFVQAVEESTNERSIGLTLKQFKREKKHSSPFIVKKSTSQYISFKMHHRSNLNSDLSNSGKFICSPQKNIFKADSGSSPYESLSCSSKVLTKESLASFYELKFLSPRKTRKWSPAEIKIDEKKLVQPPSKMNNQSSWKNNMEDNLSTRTSKIKVIPHTQDSSGKKKITCDEDKNKSEYQVTGLLVTENVKEDNLIGIMEAVKSSESRIVKLLNTAGFIADNGENTCDNLELKSKENKLSQTKLSRKKLQRAKKLLHSQSTPYFSHVSHLDSQLLKLDCNKPATEANFVEKSSISSSSADSRPLVLLDKPSKKVRRFSTFQLLELSKFENSEISSYFKADDNKEIPLINISDNEEDCAHVTKDIEESIKQVKNIKELTNRQLQHIFNKSLSFLQEVHNGKLFNQRHEDFLHGGQASRSLTFQVPLSMFKEDQIDFIMDLLMEVYCKKNPAENLDYILKVLLPVALIKVHMEVTGKSYKESDNIMSDHMFDVQSKNVTQN